MKEPLIANTASLGCHGDRTVKILRRHNALISIQVIIGQSFSTKEIITSLDLFPTHYFILYLFIVSMYNVNEVVGN